VLFLFVCCPSYLLCYFFKFFFYLCVVVVVVVIVVVVVMLFDITARCPAYAKEHKSGLGSLLRLFSTCIVLSVADNGVNDGKVFRNHQTYIIVV